MPQPLRPRPLIEQEARLVRMARELTLEPEKAPILEAVYRALDAIRDFRRPSGAQTRQGIVDFTDAPVLGAPGGRQAIIGGVVLAPKKVKP